MSAKGLLFVYGETGPDVTDRDFNAWYDEEHAPLRLTVPGIQNALRYKAIDGKTPTYIAIYNASSPEVLESNAYKNLSTHASDNERALIPKLDLLNRRIYELIDVKIRDTNSENSVANFIYPVTAFVPLDLEDEFNKYHEGYVDLISKVPGWVRTRRYKLLSGIELGRGVGSDSSKPIHNYLDLHDADRDDFHSLPEFQAFQGTPWLGKIGQQSVNSVSLRAFNLLKITEKK